MEIWKKLSAHLKERPDKLKELKNNGFKVIGYFANNFVPEEIIYAAGAIPVGLLSGGEPLAAKAALSKAIRFLCPFSRAQFGERLLQKNPYYHMIDFLIAPITCQHLRRTADLWEYYTNVKVFRLGIPHDCYSEKGLKYYFEGLKILSQKLEKLTGNTIKDEKLIDTIILYNKMRMHLKNISFKRKKSNPPISALEFVKLVHSSYKADPEFIVRELSLLDEELNQKAESPLKTKKARLLLMGPVLAKGDNKIIELCKECNTDVVIEDFSEGIRYYWENIEIVKNPLKSIANAYFIKKVPPAFMRNSAGRRFDFIAQLIKDFSVDGIIWYQVMYCETYDIESYFFNYKLKELNIPFLKLESEYDIFDTAPMKNRVEAFVENLTGESFNAS